MNIQEVIDMTSITVYDDIDEIQAISHPEEYLYLIKFEIQHCGTLTLFMTPEVIEDLQFSLWVLEVAEAEELKPQVVDGQQIESI